MSKDEKASVAAAQLLIDDEPDDWCDLVAGLVRNERADETQGQEDLQHRLRRYVAF
jgi:hypothetical protein